MVVIMVSNCPRKKTTLAAVPVSGRLVCKNYLQTKYLQPSVKNIQNLQEYIFLQFAAKRRKKRLTQKKTLQSELVHKFYWRRCRGCAVWQALARHNRLTGCGFILFAKPKFPIVQPLNVQLLH